MLSQLAATGVRYLGQGYVSDYKHAASIGGGGGGLVSVVLNPGPEEDAALETDSYIQPMLRARQHKSPSERVLLLTWWRRLQERQ